MRMGRRKKRRNEVGCSEKSERMDEKDDGRE